MALGSAAGPLATARVPPGQPSPRPGHRMGSVAVPHPRVRVPASLSIFRAPSPGEQPRGCVPHRGGAFSGPSEGGRSQPSCGCCKGNVFQGSW